MDFDEVQDAKGKGKKGKNDRQKGKARMPKSQERKEREIRKEKKVLARAKVKAKTRKPNLWQHATLVESQDILLETGEAIFDRLQVIQPMHLQEEHQ